MMTKVLFVNHSSRPAGAEFVLKDVVSVFSESAVFLFEDGMFRQLLEKQNTKVILAKNIRDMSAVRKDSNLLKTALPLAGSMISLIRQIRSISQDYDVVYANSQKAFVLTALASHFSKKKLVWHCHDILSAEHFGKIQRSLDVRLANSRTCKVIVPSKATGHAFVQAGGKDSLVKVLYNGVDASKALTTSSKQDLRRQLGLPSGFIYGVFSRLAPWKGQHIAIKALQYLPDAKCLIVGGPQFGEIKYEQFLHQHAHELNVADRVLFVGHRLNVSDYMNAVDAYCHPSIAAEPFSLAILEAMSAGLPIVASNTGGVPEVIIHNITGYLAKPGDAQNTAAMLNRVVKRPVTSRKMGTTAQRMVSDNFTIDHMQKNVKEILQNI